MKQLTKTLFLSGLLCILNIDAFATVTKIYGKVPSYVKHRISILHYPHHLFEEPELLASQQIDEQGCLDVSFDITQTTQIYLDLESYHVFFFISPGDSFHVELPVYNPKNKADKYNIFYQPRRFYLSPLSGDKRQLNISVSRFEMMMEDRFMACLNARRSTKGDSIIKRHIRDLKQLVDAEPDPFLKQYKHYKTAPFYSLAYPLDPQVQVDSFFVNASPQINNPSFWDALNSAIKNRDAIDKNDTQNKSRSLDLIKEKNIRGYTKFIKQNYGISNNSLAALIVLKDIHRLWFAETKSRDVILDFLDDLKQKNETPSFVDLVQRLYIHLSRTYPGRPAAYFELPDRKGKLVPLQLKKKVVVLNFCSPELQQCARDFISLEKIKDELGRKVEIINVVVHQETNDFINYAKEHKGKTHFVHWNNNNDLLKAYQIKGLPSYYIIDPDGKFVASPAPDPDHGLQQTLETILRLY